MAIAREAEPVGSIHDDKIARRDSCVDRSVVALRDADMDRPQLDRVVGFHDIDERALSAVMNGGHGDEGGSAMDIQQEPRVNELVGVERAVIVWELRLEPDRAGAWIDLVVQR